LRRPNTLERLIRSIKSTIDTLEREMAKWEAGSRKVLEGLRPSILNATQDPLRQGLLREKMVAIATPTCGAFIRYGLSRIPDFNASSNPSLFSKP
jgi:hypothetical protein